LEAGSTAIEELAADHGIVDVGVRVPLDVSTLKLSIWTVIFGGVPLNVTLYKNSGVAGGAADVCIPVEDPQLDKIGRPIRSASVHIRTPLFAINRLHYREIVAAILYLLSSLSESRSTERRLRQLQWTFTPVA
jgi:hypothetical protein